MIKMRSLVEASYRDKSLYSVRSELTTLSPIDCEMHVQKQRVRGQ